MDQPTAAHRTLSDGHSSFFAIVIPTHDFSSLIDRTIDVGASVEVKVCADDMDDPVHLQFHIVAGAGFKYREVLDSLFGKELVDTWLDDRNRLTIQATRDGNFELSDDQLVKLQQMVIWTIGDE